MANGVLVGGAFTNPIPPDLAALKEMDDIHTFSDGSTLLVNGETDEHGLPVAFIAHPDLIVPVDAHPRHPGVVVRPGESRQDYVAPSAPVPHVTRVPVAQVIELKRAGIFKSVTKKSADSSADDATDRVTAAQRELDRAKAAKAADDATR